MAMMLVSSRAAQSPTDQELATGVMAANLAIKLFTKVQDSKEPKARRKELESIPYLVDYNTIKHQQASPDGPLTMIQKGICVKDRILQNLLEDCAGGMCYNAVFYL